MGCGREAAVIAAIRTSKKLFYRPQAEGSEADMAHAKFRASQESDLLNLLNVFQQAEQADKRGGLSQWCRENYVSWLALKEVRQNYQQLVEQARRQGYTLNKDAAAPEVVRKAIAAGFPDKVFKSVGRGWYENTITGERAQLGRESSTTGDLIIANELITIQTRRGGELPLITLATKMEPEWVEN